MKITVVDLLPGASAGRSAYLERRAARALTEHSDRILELSIELHPGQPASAGRSRVDLVARLPTTVVRVSSPRRLLADAIADAFDALLTKLQRHYPAPTFSPALQVGGAAGAPRARV